MLDQEDDASTAASSARGDEEVDIRVLTIPHPVDELDFRSEVVHVPATPPLTVQKEANHSLASPFVLGGRNFLGEGWSGEGERKENYRTSLDQKPADHRHGTPFWDLLWAGPEWPVVSK